MLVKELNALLSEFNENADIAIIATVPWRKVNGNMVYKKRKCSIDGIRKGTSMSYGLMATVNKKLFEGRKKTDYTEPAFTYFNKIGFVDGTPTTVMCNKCNETWVGRIRNYGKEQYELDMESVASHRCRKVCNSRSK